MVNAVNSKFDVDWIIPKNINDYVEVNSGVFMNITDDEDNIPNN